MVRERTALEFTRSTSYAFDPDAIERMEFKYSDFVARAIRHGIEAPAISSFLASRAFTDHGYTFDVERQVIVKEMR
jgi:hypothetical protein